MNANHERLCPSPEWARYIQEEVLPSVVEGADLGDDMLEIGPGPGAATDWLRRRVARLTAVEIDPAAAERLKSKFGGTNVHVAVGDATSLDYADGSFDSVGSFTMLHHVRTLPEQRAVLAETHRVLRPGGVLVGSDSLASTELHDFHAGDAYNPIDPVVLLALLRGTGFARITVTLDGVLMFAARKSCSGAAGPAGGAGAGRARRCDDTAPPGDATRAPDRVKTGETGRRDEAPS